MQKGLQHFEVSHFEVVPQVQEVVNRIERMFIAIRVLSYNFYMPKLKLSKVKKVAKETKNIESFFFSISQSFFHRNRTKS